MNKNKEFLKSLKPISSYAFAHKTSNNNVVKILEDGYLLSSIETDIQGEGYEGEEYKVFFSIIIPNDKIKPDVLYDKQTLLIFDPKIYSDYGMKDLCHFSFGWNFGNIEENSIFYNKFENFDYNDREKLKLNLNYIDMQIGEEKDYIDPDGTITFNVNTELVVYEKVPIDKYLKFIFVAPGVNLNFIPEKYRNLVINDINNPKIKKYINVKAWGVKNMKKVLEMIELIKNRKPKIPKGFFN